jgi:hypothetical protein
MPAAIRRIHSKYLGEKTLPKEISELEIPQFFTLGAADLRAIRAACKIRVKTCHREGLTQEGLL